MHKKVNFFGKKLPAWLLLAALVVVGAGAATGLVLKDSVNGTTTIAVSQAILVDTPVVHASVSDQDEFLATSDDDGTEWAVHFEANNGDVLQFYLPIKNEGANTIVIQMDVDIPDGISMSVDTADSANANWDNDVTGEAQVGPSTWKASVNGDAQGNANTASFEVDGDANNNNDDDGLLITLAIEDAQPTGFYTLVFTIVPLNV